MSVPGMDLVQFIKLVGAEQVKAALDSVIQKEEQVGTPMAQVTQQGEKQTEMFGALTSRVVSFVAGWAGFQTVLNWVERYSRALKESLDTLKEFGNTAVEVQKKVQLLAIQLGDPSEKGMLKAMTLARDVSAAGNMPIETGVNIMASVASTYPNATRENQLKIAKEVATIAGVNAMDPASASSMVELLKVTGKEDVGSASKFLAQFDAAMKTSPAIKFGPFAEATIKGGTAMSTMGLKDEELLKLMVQARAVSGGSEDVAGETMKMLAYATNAPKMRKHFTQMGIQGGQIGPKIAEIERQAKAAIAGDPEARARFPEELRSEQLMRMLLLFSPAAVKQGQEFETALPHFTPEKYRGEAAQFGGTKMAMQTKLEREIAIGRAQMDKDQFKKVLLSQIVDEQIKQMKITDPEAFTQIKSEEALRDELMHRASGLFGGVAEGATLPEQDVMGPLRPGPMAGQAGYKPSPQSGMFLGGVAGLAAPPASSLFGVGDKPTPAPVMHIQNYVEHQVVPQSSLVTMPAAAANSRPGGGT